MTLIIQPDAGVAPVLTAIRKAKRSIDIVIFRLDIKEVIDALGQAVGRGVAVRALIAHTNRGGEKTLRKLELRLLELGVTVSRTADDLVRYHGKMMVIDGRTVHVLGFNFTKLDVDRSRSFGIATSCRTLVREAQKLFQADCDRQPYEWASRRFVVSPENARPVLSALIESARRQLLIYDPEVSDPRILRLLAERKAAGVDVRIIGRVSRAGVLPVEEHAEKRLHVRAIVRDGERAFVGSQSLRKVELDRRREIGVVVTERALVRQLVGVFERDWAQAQAGHEASQPAVTEAKQLSTDAVAV